MPSLCSLSASRLSELLARKEVSSAELVGAHLERIEKYDPRLRAFTAVFADEARRAARASDEARARGEVRGPLHGLPVSIKESIDMKGLDTTLGVEARRGNPAARDASIVEALRAAGAVVLGRTNVSQFLLFHESRNPLFGQTANPFRLSHTPGGSSGGEAAALAAGLSPLGIGTDIGGSIRVPAHFSGICGLKPTLDRWPNRGVQTALAGQEAVRGQVGPMARTARDLCLALGALPAPTLSALDGRVPPLGFQDPTTIDISRLRIGFYTEGGLIAPSQSVAAAVERALGVLKDRGCEARLFAPPDAAHAVFQYLAALSADGSETVMRALGSGEIDVALRTVQKVARLPNPLRRAAARAVRAAGEERAGRLLSSIGRKGVAEFWRLTSWIRNYRFVMQQALDDAGIDVLLCPAHATPALPHTFSADFLLAGSDSMLWNICQFPAGVVPVSTVRPDQLERQAILDRFDRTAAEVDRQSLGLPVGVQVVGRPWAEAQVLAVMLAIEEGVRGDAGFPETPVDPVLKLRLNAPALV